MDRWLFLDSGSAPGAENMAVDELLLERAEGEGRAPVLRLYSFEPSALTIGAHQDPGKILDVEAVRADGIDVVRRITGGRALLHDGELTYCVVARAHAAPFGSGLSEAYMRISAALRAALRLLGVDAEISRARELSKPKGATPPCLSSATRYELTAGGKKVAGSAQRKTAGAFLQHGSILLRPGSERIVKYLSGSWDHLGNRVTSLSGELGREVDAGALRFAVANAFAEEFAAVWEPLRLSKRDGEEVRRRARAKREEFAGLFVREAGTP